MELRKSKRIYAAGTTDDFMNSKKNKNLNNQKLFEKVTNHMSPTTQQKTGDPAPQSEKNNFGPNYSIIERIEIMFQKDPKDTQNKANIIIIKSLVKIIIRKFDDDYKKYQKLGDNIIDKIQPHYVPNVKYQEIPSQIVINDTNNQSRFEQTLMMNKNSSTSKIHNNIANNTTLQLTDIKRKIIGFLSHYKANNIIDRTSTMLNTSKSSSTQGGFAFNLNKTQSTSTLFPNQGKGLREVEWLKYAADREDTLPSIMRNIGMKGYLNNVPYTKDDSFQIPNIVKREQTKARVMLLQELSSQKKHSMSQIKSAIKFQAVTSDNNNDKLGIPVFQQKQKNKQQKFLKKQQSVKSMRESSASGMFNIGGNNSNQMVNGLFSPMGRKSNSSMMNHQIHSGITILPSVSNRMNQMTSPTSPVNRVL